MTEQQASPWIVDVTNENFQAEVFDRSSELPVVLDFWSARCEPCRQLAPILEKLAVEYAGGFVLAKVNVDECPQIAGAFGVQSIPVVLALANAQPVDHFQGLLPEDQIRKWLDAFAMSPAEQAFRAGEELEADDPAAAALKYREAIEQSPDDPRYLIAMARLALATDQEQECREILERLESRGFLEPEAERLKSQLEVLDDAEESGGVQEARAAAEASPDDLSLLVALANALAADKKYTEACDICLDVITRDKYGVGNEAKETMVRILEMLGPRSELAGQYRRKLATAFY